MRSTYIEATYTKYIDPKWLQRERLERAYSYREAAAFLGISAAYLSDIEKGRRKLKADSEAGKNVLEMWQ